MNYGEAIAYLYTLGNELHTAKFGLERIGTLLAALGNPHHGGRFIHVAGTNGKGSTCAMIEAGLRAAGQRTALYTSPHLVEPTERIQVGGRRISEEKFAAAFERVHYCAEELLDNGSIDLHPTYFETITAMAFLLFRDAGVERAVLEVGLGGRLDATNVVIPEVCVITPVDYDHQQYLGDHLHQIASEKAGILKPGVPAVISCQHATAMEAIKEAAARVHAPLRFASDWSIEDVACNERGCRFRTRGADIACPLPGEHQIGNALTAAIALEQVGVAPAGIAETRWPGRLERVSTTPEIILDGAHNVAGTRALAHYIRQFYSDRRVWIVYAVMRDKAVSEMTSLLFPLATRVIATAPANARALPPAEIPGDNVTIAPTVSAALDLVRRKAAPNDAVFVTGSLFLIGEARALLVK